MNPEIWKIVKEHFGSQVNLAKALGVSKSLVSVWVAQKRPISLECGLRLIEMMPYRFTMKDLRPDIYLK